jgi:hypothetical protein
VITEEEIAALNSLEYVTLIRGRYEEAVELLESGVRSALSGVVPRFHLEMVINSWRRK